MLRAAVSVKRLLVKAAFSNYSGFNYYLFSGIETGILLRLLEIRHNPTQSTRYPRHTDLFLPCSRKVSTIVCGYLSQILAKYFWFEMFPSFSPLTQSCTHSQGNILHPQCKEMTVNYLQAERCGRAQVTSFSNHLFEGLKLNISNAAEI